MLATRVDDPERYMQELGRALSMLPDAPSLVRVEYGAGPSARSVRWTLRTMNKSSPYMRRAASGRATNGVNWEAHRIVMMHMFSQFPGHTLKTALATYKGEADFSARHESTWSHQSGSRMAPASFGSL